MGGGKYREILLVCLNIAQEYRAIEDPYAIPCLARCKLRIYFREENLLGDFGGTYNDIDLVTIVIRC